MIKRKIQPILLELAKTYPVITITGPRQSGKITLAKMVFPDYSILRLNDISGSKANGCVVYGGNMHFTSSQNILVTGFENFSGLI